MILIKVYGLDQFVVGNYSKEHTKKIADLFEAKEEDVMFYAPNSFIFYKGVDQTSWNTVIEVMCPNKYHPLQEVIDKYLIETFKLFTINIHIVFTYYDEHHLKEEFNEKYPRFISEKNLVHVHEEDTSDVDILDEEQVFTGNVFKNFKK